MSKTSILFVCLGNICRSPAAEAIFVKLINDMSLEDKFIVDSAGTGSWHVGKKADSRMRFAASQRNINITSFARKINEYDFENFNYIIAMDNSNFDNILSFKNKYNASDFAKIIKMQDFASNYSEEEVPDPYFGGNEGFNYVLDILEDSINSLIEKLT